MGRAKSKVKRQGAKVKSATIPGFGFCLSFLLILLPFEF
jgi:hypothetical protein